MRGKVMTYLVSFRHSHADAGCLGLVEEKLKYYHQAHKGWALLGCTLAAAADLQTVVIRLCMGHSVLQSSRTAAMSLLML